MKKILAFILAFALAMTISTAASAEGDNWEACEGKTIQVALVEHNVSSCIISKVDEFTEKTGIRVEMITIPESNYFEKISSDGKGHGYNVYGGGNYREQSLIDICLFLKLQPMKRVFKPDQE